jgi:hypothetical protein
MVMHRRRTPPRLGVAKASAVVAVAVGTAVSGATAVAVAGDPPDEGLITLDDLPAGWEDGPVEEDEDDEETDRAARKIDACKRFVKASKTIENAPQAESPTFSSRDQKISSDVAQLKKEATAEDLFGVLDSDRSVECFRKVFRLLLTREVEEQGGGDGTPSFSAEIERGPGLDVGDESSALTVDLTVEAQGAEASFFFELLVVRVGPTLAAYEFESEGGRGDVEVFMTAADAAASRI